MRLSSLALIGLLLSSTVGTALTPVNAARSQPAACAAGSSLLLVQTPADGFPDAGFRDGLRVVDSCGAERGTIDVPSPSIVWPMAKPGVAIVYTGPIAPDDAKGATYLVDAATLTATELEVPDLTVARAREALYSLNSRQSPRHALVGSVGEDAEIWLVELATGGTTDVIASLPDDVVGEGAFYEGWVDPEHDAIVLQVGFDQVTAPLGDLSAAVRQPLAPYEPEPRDADGCVRSWGIEGGPGLFSCVLGDGSYEWRVGPGGDARPEAVAGLANHDPESPSGEWSTASMFRTFIPSPTSFRRGWDDPAAPVEWIPFVDFDWDSFRGGFTATDDLSTMVVVDAPARTVSRIEGLAAGRGALRMNAPVDGGRYILVLWLPWSQDLYDLIGAADPRVIELIVTSGQLYLVNLEEAMATLLDGWSGGVISPDSGSLALTRLDVGGAPTALSVGPVGGPPVEVGSGFGTWLTP